MQCSPVMDRLALETSLLTVIAASLLMSPSLILGGIKTFCTATARGWRMWMWMGGWGEGDN